MTNTIGTVYLRTANLERLVTFYQDVIGLQVQRVDGDTTYLGVDDTDLLALIHTPDGRKYAGVTGLFHFALLVPARADLAKSLKHLVETRTRLQGMSDHLVSEAVYLADPDGNGIEIYRDRPREDWVDAQGSFQMDTIPMGYQGVMSTLDAAAATWNGIASGTVMGHIHLHVSDIPQSNTYYTDALGMDLMANWSSALFLSYDGYHHHVGANTWGGRNPAPADALGLSHFELRLPDHQLQALLGHFDQAGLPVDARDDGHLIRDPSANAILLQSIDGLHG